MVLWRVVVLAAPRWRERCARCAVLSDFVCVDRFRVNSHGERHDVWLLYRCSRCGGTRKRRIARRRRAHELPPGRVEPYLRDDAGWLRRHAFELPLREPLPYRVERPALPSEGALEVGIDQPRPCGVRWDRFLAGELGCSRSALARRLRTGRVRLSPGVRAADPVAHGQRFVAELCVPSSGPGAAGGVPRYMSRPCPPPPPTSSASPRTARSGPSR